MSNHYYTIEEESQIFKNKCEQALLLQLLPATGTGTTANTNIAVLLRILERKKLWENDYEMFILYFVTQNADVNMYWVQRTKILKLAAQVALAARFFKI